MNALHVKPGVSLKHTLDELIADHGLRSVLLALLGRITKRTRPPDISVGPAAKDAPGLDLLNDHLRADLGLPPALPKRSFPELHGLSDRYY